MIIFMVFIVIESGFILTTVIRVHQFSPVQVDAMKKLLALSPIQVWALCTLALAPKESDAPYSVDSRV
jgi:hypothetical protein